MSNERGGQDGGDDLLKTKVTIALAVAVAFLGGIGLAAQFGFVELRSAPEAVRVETQAQLPAAAVQPALDLSDAFVAIAEAVTPSVVRIEAQRREEARRLSLNEFFQRRPDPRRQQLVRRGGSGFVVTGDGYVMTNNHVVEDAEEISVILSDGRTFDAELVGADPTTDVAVVKIEGPDLVPVSLGSSAEVRVGEWVLAIGNPGFGPNAVAGALDFTVTAGIVSARGRSLDLIRQELQNDGATTAGFAIEDFIQTDAAINQGNSGGPMVDLRGQVIGINAALASQTGFYMGYGFAIPIDLARRIMEDLVEYGRVRRAYLGVRMVAVTPEDAEVYGLPEIAGALVQSVEEDTPAAAAGLGQEDVITAVEGVPVRSSNDLQHKIALRTPGDRVRITIYRDGAPQDVTVRLGEAPLSEEVAEPAPEAQGQTSDKLGVEVAEITSEVAGALRLESTDGAVVTDVEQGGPAHRRGIERGCVIREINRRSVNDPGDVTDALRDVGAGEVVSVRVLCGAGEPNVVNVRTRR